MGKKSESRIEIDLLQRHAEVPSPEAFRDRYVSQYAGRPLGRPAFVAPEPEPEPEPVATLPGLDGEAPVEATTLIDAFQDDVVGVPDDAPVADPFAEGEAMASEGIQEEATEAAGIDPVVEDPFAGGDVVEGAVEEAPEGATRLIDALDEPADEFVPPEEPSGGAETTSFEAVDASPEDVWGAPAEEEPAPAPEGHGTVVMGALTDAEPDGSGGDAGDGDAAKEAPQGGKKKKKRRHR
jgi:hypothetical protein